MTELQDTLSELDLIVTNNKACLSYQRQELIKFSAKIKITPSEVVDYVNRGVLRQLTELCRIGEETDLKITIRLDSTEHNYPFMNDRQPMKRLLLQQKWYTLYFISEERSFTGIPQEHVATALQQLSSLFAPGNALVDYENYRIFLGALEHGNQHSAINNYPDPPGLQKPPRRLKTNN